MNIKKTFEESFKIYAGMTIKERSICDARDMLKPSAREAMYAQFLEGITPDKPHKKSQKSIAAAMDHFYVHGDQSLYPMLARMGKPFAMRYVLEDFQGNTGTISDSTDVAAPRYTEMRLSPLSMYLLGDIKKDTIEKWYPNYSGDEYAPSVLPSKGFYNIVNGTSGIATGIASSIPQFNLKEVNNALTILIDRPDAPDDEIICMPDFAGGGILLNRDEVKESLLNGTGAACKLRAKVEYDSKGGRLIITEIPYGIYTGKIMKQLKDIAHSDDNPGIVRPLDGSGDFASLEIEVNKKANIDKIIKYLYKNTFIQYHFPINMVMLDKGKTPRVFGWREALLAHIEHEKVVYRRSFEFDLKKVRNRIHILDGLLVCLASIDEVVKVIKNSASSIAAANELKSKFLLDDAQVKAVLDMKLSKLAHLEVSKVQNERDELQKEDDRISEILNNEKLLNEEIKKGWREVSEKFGDGRRTKIIQLAEGADSEPIEEKQLSLAFTNMGAVYVSETSTLYSQRRNGTGTKFKLEKEEYIIDNIVGKNTSELLFFTDKGNFYHKNMGEFMVDEKQYLTSMVNMGNNEKVVTAALCSKSGQKQHIIFITKKGILKKSKLSEYNLKRNSGALAIKLDADDEIVSIMFADDDRIGIASAQGQFIMIETKDISAIGRVARGVQGMKLNDGDYVVGARLINSNDKEIISVSTDGYIKRTSIDEFRVTGRATKGVKIQNTNSLCDFLPVGNENDILVVSTSSQIRLKFNDIPSLSRGTQGVKSLKLSNGAQVITLSKL